MSTVQRDIYLSRIGMFRSVRLSTFQGCPRGRVPLRAGTNVDLPFEASFEKALNGSKLRLYIEYATYTHLADVLHDGT